MAEYRAPGWPADWLNAWLAAIGVTVLLQDVTLRWSDDVLPIAIFGGDVDDLPQRIFDALPTEDEVARYAIARVHDATSIEFPRKVDDLAYRARSVVARALGDPSLMSSVTDLKVEDDKTLGHSRFDPPAPKGVTLHDRLVLCAEAAKERGAAAVAESMFGTATRVKRNGLGFDYRRLHSATVVGSEPMVDPIVEVLTFCGMSLAYCRGDGRRINVRGWGADNKAFTWLAWSDPHRIAGIDALLDQYWAGRRIGPLVARYETVAYKSLGSADSTRAYASRPVVS